jgi:hypothetical protein
MPRFPKGVLSVNRADFHLQNRMGNWMNYTSSYLFLPYIELYNNSAQGQWLYVVAVDAIVSNNNPGLIELYQGTYATVPPLLPSAPVNPLAPIGPGVFGAHEQSKCIGTHVYGLGDNSIYSWEWVHDYPLVAIPPGWSCALQGNATQQYLSCAMQWLYGSSP